MELMKSFIALWNTQLEIKHRLNNQMIRYNVIKE